ncbi:MAG: alpha/beta hydrolase, partial [Muribaculaceae bacterium]
MNIKSLLFAVAAIFTASTSTAQAQADYEVKYLDLGHQSAALYEPLQKTEKASIGIVVMHSTQNYMSFIANGELAQRGYTVIALEAPSGEIQSDKWLAEKKGVDYLHSRQDIKKVVLLGHSGGATTTTAYQAIAEQGKDFLKGKLYNDYPENIANLPKADGVILLDANYGNGVMTLLSLDPNVTDETTGMNVSQTLDLAAPANGYSPDGSKYPAEFVKTYIQAQAARLNRLTDAARERLSLIKAGKGRFSDDEPFLVPGGAQPRFNNRLVPQDISLLSHTKCAWPLLHADGSITTEVVHCLRAPMGFRSGTDRLGNSIETTVKGFLSGFSLSTNSQLMIYEDRIEGIDWASNINNGIGNAAGITVPLLCMGMTGSYEYLAAEWIYN